MERDVLGTKQRSERSDEGAAREQSNTESDPTARAGVTRGKNPKRINGTFDDGAREKTRTRTISGWNNIGNLVWGASRALVCTLTRWERYGKPCDKEALTAKNPSENMPMSAFPSRKNDLARETVLAPVKGDGTPDLFNQRMHHATAEAVSRRRRDWRAAPLSPADRELDVE